MVRIEKRFDEWEGEEKGREWREKMSERKMANKTNYLP